MAIATRSKVSVVCAVLVFDIRHVLLFGSGSGDANVKFLCGAMLQTMADLGRKSLGPDNKIHFWMSRLTKHIPRLYLVCFLQQSCELGKSYCSSPFPDE